MTLGETALNPVIVKLSDPKVAAIVADLPAMQRWEVLRRSEDPMTPQQLATACRVGVESMQHTLDRLVDAGLAVRVKATRTSKRTTYRTVGRQLVVEWNANLPDDVRWIADQRESVKQYGRRVIDRAHSAMNRRSLNWASADIAFVLTRSEADEALKIITDALQALSQLEERAYRRAQATPHGAETARSSGFYAAMQLQQLEEPELPIPEYTAWEARGVAGRVEQIKKRPQSVLTAKETEVARRLAAGESRPEIAAALGLSPNTVATTSKRIYTKLGVHTRAELASRMHGA
jgi:DNA-binding CsgD family transcriptional regulator